MEKDYAEKLIKEYSKKQTTELDNLKALNKKVKKPATLFAYIFGSIGALILGVGMCLAMNIIGGTTAFMVVGIIVGIVGIAMVSLNYLLYNKILTNRKNKYADEVLTLSNEILNKEQ